MPKSAMRLLFLCKRLLQICGRKQPIDKLLTHSRASVVKIIQLGSLLATNDDYSPRLCLVANSFHRLGCLPTPWSQGFRRTQPKVLKQDDDAFGFLVCFFVKNDLL